MTKQKEILALRKKKWTLQAIGDKYNITMERVRQILNSEIFYCPKHQKKSSGVCLYCKIENEYIPKVKKFTASELQAECKRMQKETSRETEAILKRIALVKVFKDSCGLNFSEIGRLLNRDRKSVANLYNKACIKY